MSIRLIYCLFALVLFNLAACESFDVNVNDQVVHTPQPLFSDFEIPDEGLSQCLQRAISHGGISAASQLKDLNCSNAGIANLEGLTGFRDLLKLRLSANQVEDVTAIVSLQSLQELYLDGNAVVDPTPLYGLKSLRFLDLSGNPDLRCPGAGELAHIQRVDLPRHCR
jgi:Leucine-rich repeat (LRR) protein